MFKKILLPCDGSRHSLEAARIAAEIAVRYEGAVRPVVAVEFQYAADEELPAEVSAAICARIRARAASALAAAGEALREVGAAVEPGRVLEGPSAEAILWEAEDGEYDLIVMGSRGVSLDSGFDRLIGSVTERVLHRAPCPVLVIRAEPRP